MDWGALVGPAVVAAVVSGGISLWSAYMNRAMHSEKLEADRRLAERRFEFDKNMAERKFLAEQEQADWERRNKTYQSIIERLPALVAGRLNPDKTDELLTETRRLWLIASPAVVRTINEFISAVEAGRTPYGSLEEHLGVMILALRQDMVPADGTLAPSLTQADFRIKSATRRSAT